MQVAYLTRLTELNDDEYVAALKGLKSDHFILSQLVKISRVYERVLQRALRSSLMIFDDFYPNKLADYQNMWSHTQTIESDQFAWGATLSALATDPPRTKLQEVVDFYVRALGLSCDDLKDLTKMPISCVMLPVRALPHPLFHTIVSHVFLIYLCVKEEQCYCDLWIVFFLWVCMCIAAASECGGRFFGCGGTQAWRSHVGAGVGTSGFERW
jgi:hypothetical protein